ncbi:hypothetical protein DCC39_11735 [Pueribacillus theae]|uniref:Lipoprotein n=1 Tax=Pueribacillus theae TaxID=2171751 RepID=A0A2U1JXW7_9BACI|nr:MetQ/NlpA family ABC transporter substrate-binding protein [Pueribacillus theae]PWA10061.1 hypothetical protein DCC39_11735 [Pueribacillus theae]
MKKVFSVLTVILLVGLLAACGGTKDAGSDGKKAEDSKTEKTELKFGATAGPYSDMISKAIKPLLEEKGYKIEVVEFSDYVQPNIALDNGSLDVNMFQHKIYLDNFVKEHNLELSDLITIPTVPIGLYSNKIKSIEEIQDGSTIAIPNDPTNLARALLMLQDADLITISDHVEPLKASEKDVKDNPKNIKFQPVEAAQLPRTLESVDLAAINGNFALAAKMNLLDALVLENIVPEYQNLIAVRTADLDAQFTKDIKEVVESPEFEEIIDKDFQGYSKPDWMK